MNNKHPIEVVDLSRKNQAQQRHVYTTLLRNWWPHPIHGELAMMFTPDAMLFRCACGAVLRIEHAAAASLGLL